MDYAHFDTREGERKTPTAQFNRPDIGEKLQKLREGAFEREISPAVAQLEPDEENDDLKIVRTKRFSIKPMTPEEAVLQMTLLGHEFFAFKNREDNDAFAIVYKRKSGGYGLIDSE